MLAKFPTFKRVVSWFKPYPDLLDLIRRLRKDLLGIVVADVVAINHDSVVTDAASGSPHIEARKPGER